MSEFGTINAVIESVSLGYESHGILTAFLTVHHERGHQGFGGYVLGNHDEVHPHCGKFIKRVLETVGVDSWEDLKGKPCRVRGDSGGLTHLGHFLEDKWFCPKEEWKEDE